MRHAALLLVLLAGAGCASQDSKQHEAAQKAASWTAAAQMTMQQWADGHTTAPFTRTALERAGRDLETLRQEVPPYAAAAVEAARAQLTAARDDVQRNDRGGARQRAGALGDICAQLRHAAGEDQP
jgi:hypothetical protein